MSSERPLGLIRQRELVEDDEMKLTVTTFLTVDGVMQGPGGPEEDRSGGFERGGWLVPHFDKETGKFILEVFGRVDAFLLGRRTWQIFESYWPKHDDPNDPVAHGLNTLPKHVPSTTLKNPDWANTHVIDGDVEAAIRELKAQPGGELQVHGSGHLVRWLLERELIDELNLLVFPVVVGDGVRLFADKGQATGLKLKESRTTPSGVAIHVYEAAGRPTFGSVDAA
jgi:dihydrofolate reductase